MHKNVIETKGVGKEFNGVWVLKDIDFTLRKGEIHALVGENGAGKSTFIKILSGIYSRSTGEIMMNDKQVVFSNAEQSEKAGIRTVHQEMQLIPGFRVYQNIFLGNESNKMVAGLRVMKDREMRRKSRQILDSLECNLDENAITANLNTSLKKIIEISKVLLYEPEVIIFDEPTTALGEIERQMLLRTIIGLKEKGVSIIYISHNLEEIAQIADRATVFRDGRKVAELEKNEIVIDTIIMHMLGNKTYNNFRRNDYCATDEIVLSAKNVCTDKLKNISFEARKGEVVGFAGVVGAGKTEVAQAIFGMDRIHSGEIEFLGKKLNHTVRKAIDNGIALVPEERQAQGIIPAYSVTKNITLSYMEKWSPMFVFNSKAENQTCREYIDTLNIKTTGPSQHIRNLSGGNQQKAILARWMVGDFKLGIFDDPTKGIDIKAKEDIYKLIDTFAHEGKTILMMSSYLPELLSVCDRIIVLHEGEKVGEFDPMDPDAEKKITTAMLGGR